MTTRQFKRTALCPNCGCRVPLIDTCGLWIRKHPRLDSSEGIALTDLDVIVHRYKTGYDRTIQYLMVVEIKTLGAEMTDSQRDTLGIFGQVMRNRVSTPNRQRIFFQAEKRVTKALSTMIGRQITVKLLGVHLLSMDGDDPDTSSRITWDRRAITVDQLIRLLRCEIDPDTFQPMNNRSRHKQRLLPLQELKP